ncbi:hypothetical protein ACIQX3_22550 [Peribacillus frigoritolerans]|uniref:hypothetical protein n=1 Tax=Peribacillus frigoritolerans TaxID=450367 RepID=UPI0037F3EE25
MSKLYFRASRSAMTQITELFDFVWPTVAGVWNLKWQVNGYLSLNPGANQDELYNKFILGSGIHSVNFDASIIKPTWEEQEGNFAKIILTNIFAIHESWLAELIGIFNLGSTTHNTIKNLQFPSSIRSAISNLCSNESQMLKNVFYNELISNRKNSLSNLENLQKCYRFFKESRNCIVHNGGIADQKLINAYSDYYVVANTTALDVDEVPFINPVSLGSEIKVELRGGVGLCNIIIRIITTCDAELSKSIHAENEFKEHWKNSGEKGRTLSPNPTKRTTQIKRYVKKIGYPEPLIPLKYRGLKSV